jgi:hypothetical protein
VYWRKQTFRINPCGNEAYRSPNSAGRGIQAKANKFSRTKRRSGKMSFVVYNPASGPTAEKMGMAPRIENLQNGVLGVIDNGKTNSDTVLNRIVAKLAGRFSLQDVVTVKKHSVSHAIKDDAARMLAQKCNFVLAGIGD